MYKSNNEVSLQLTCWEGGYVPALKSIEAGYLKERSKRLFIEKVNYSSGAGLLRKIREQEGGREFDDARIVIGDREIICACARLGWLSPLKHDLVTKVRAQVIPELHEHEVSMRGHVYGLPLRWGTTPILCRKGMVADFVAHWGSALADAKRVLLWNPDDYYLYSMSVLATAISCSRPLHLSDDEFKKVERMLDGMGAHADVALAESVPEFIKRLVNEEFDIVTCGGEWALEIIRVRDEKAYKRICERYDYFFPCNRPICFFETAAIMSAPNNELAHDVIEFLMRPEINRGEAYADFWSGEEFYWNPIYKESPAYKGGEAMVLGPNFKRVPAREILTTCMQREFPADELYRPTHEIWRAAWTRFLTSAREVAASKAEAVLKVSIS